MPLFLLRSISPSFAALSLLAMIIVGSWTAPAAAAVITRDVDISLEMLPLGGPRYGDAADFDSAVVLRG